MIRLPTWMRLVKNTKRYFAVRCTECYWQGCSSETFGGGPLADTGDYCDIECPKCSSTELDTETIPDVFNPFYWVLYWLKRPVILYRQYRYNRAMLKDYEDWEKKTKKELEQK